MDLIHDDWLQRPRKQKLSVFPFLRLGPEISDSYFCAILLVSAGHKAGSILMDGATHTNRVQGKRNYDRSSGNHPSNDGRSHT